MLHALYIIAFAILTTLAVGNLIRNLLLLGGDLGKGPRGTSAKGNRAQRDDSTLHPEMLDDLGQVLDEPLLVMRSISLKDARERLDALYDGKSPSSEESVEDE